MQLRTQAEGPLLWTTIASPNNTITAPLIGEISLLLEAHERDDDSRVLILQGGGGKFFSPGFNLSEVAGYDRRAMAEFTAAFTRLYARLFAHPKPTLAMLDGHAIAGGCILASCCDFRFARPRVMVGLTEMSLAVPVPAGSLLIIQQLIGYPHCRTAAYLGESYPVEKALSMGWVDRIWPAAELRERTREEALRLARQEAGAFRLLKSYYRDPVLSRLERVEGAELDRFLDCWFAAPAQEKIQALLSRLGR